MKRSKLHTILTSFALAASISYASLASAAFLDLDTTGPEDILIGASDVQIGTRLYDVTFVDGTYNMLTATGELHHAFSTLGEARNAANAIFSQVLANSNFDTNPRLITGCGDVLLCDIFTPFAVVNNVVHMSEAQNFNIPPDGIAVNGTFSADRDTASLTSIVYANWTLIGPAPESNVSNVPEPSTYAMMALGLLGIAGMRRRQNQA